jgi:predicted protein tyrosine phosphatase
MVAITGCRRAAPYTASASGQGDIIVQQPTNQPEEEIIFNVIVEERPYEIEPLPAQIVRTDFINPHASCFSARINCVDGVNISECGKAYYQAWTASVIEGLTPNTIVETDTFSRAEAEFWYEYFFTLTRSLRGRPMDEIFVLSFDLMGDYDVDLFVPTLDRLQMRELKQTAMVIMDDSTPMKLLNEEHVVQLFKFFDEYAVGEELVLEIIFSVTKEDEIQLRYFISWDVLGGSAEVYGRDSVNYFNVTYDWNNTARQFDTTNWIIE